MIVQRAVGHELSDGAFAVRDPPGDLPQVVRQPDHVVHRARGLREDGLVVERRRDRDGVALHQGAVARRADRDVDDLVAEQAERAHARLGVGADLLVQVVVDGDPQLEIARRVVVDGEKIDRLDRPGELPGDEHRAAGPQSAGVRQIGDELVPLVKEIRRLAELVDRHAEHEERDHDERADLELIPGDE